MSTSPRPVRTRFAPSPTGYLHIGGVRTALFNWLFARQQGGKFILRIDDTDAERNQPEALQPILDGFRWLGIDWDEGPEVGGPFEPYFQSERSERYAAAVKTLLEKGYAYRDYATKEELDAERKVAEAEKRPYLYTRRWMAETDAEASKFEAEGRTGTVRLKMPREGKCVIQDRICGETSFEWSREQDLIIQRGNGGYVYHLANVVDDYDFQITHVIRGIEHLPNTPRQVYMIQGLGYPMPEYAHLPYVAAPGSKEKMSKRKIKDYLKNPEFKRLYDHGEGIAKLIGHEGTADTFNPVLVDFYAKVGYLPEAILNYLALVGWSLDDKTEDFTRDELVKVFTLDRVVKAPASFDPKKLWNFQDRHMTKLPLKQKVAKMLPYLQQAGLVSSPPPCEIGPMLSRIIEAAGDRLKVAGDILSYADFFFVADDKLVYDEKDFEKRVKKEGGKELLVKFKEKLAAVEPFTAQPLEQMMHAFLEEQGIKIGDIVHTVRVAVTGKGVGPGLYDCLELIGKERCLRRIDQAVAKI